MKSQDHNATSNSDNNVWVIEYHPLNDSMPIFLVWYTDTDPDNTDKLLTYKTGNIFTTNSLRNLKTEILESVSVIDKFETLDNWLVDFDENNRIEITIYDIGKAISAIQAQNLEIETLEEITNFMNLVGDYAYQHADNQYLMPLLDNKHLRKVWTYYYDIVFWPRFNDKDKFAIWERPPFDIDIAKLTKGIEELAVSFERKMAKHNNKPL